VTVSDPLRNLPNNAETISSRLRHTGRLLLSGASHDHERLHSAEREHGQCGPDQSLKKKLTKTDHPVLITGNITLKLYHESQQTASLDPDYPVRQSLTAVVD